MSEAANRRVRETAQRILESAVPIYREEERGTPSLVGSAVLLKICDAKFLKIFPVRGRFVRRFVAKSNSEAEQATRAQTLAISLFPA